MFVWFVDGLVAANMVSFTVYGVIMGVLKLQLVGTDGCARAQAKRQRQMQLSESLSK